MVYFQTPKTIWVTFGRYCNGRCWYFLWPFRLLGLFLAVCYILWLFGIFFPFWFAYMYVIFYGHLVHFVAIWYILPRFGMLYREKSGNPVLSETE
jgi:hypothetical protein